MAIEISCARCEHQVGIAARYRGGTRQEPEVLIARADDLVIPEGQEELQETLTNVLDDLARAGRLVINSLDAVGFQNIGVAQQDILEARDTLSIASPIIVEIVSQTAVEPE